MIETELPFRPYTLDEVGRLTRVLTGALEGWLKTALTLKVGDDLMTQGLDHMGTFAVFCGQRWLDGGAGTDRAGRVVRFVAGMNEVAMRQEFRRGNTFPQINDDAPKLLVRPPGSKLGVDLNLRTLYREFLAELAKMFPRG